MATLVVEDGTIVTGANSFVSLVDARARADQLGITLPIDDDDAIVSLIRGAAYVCSFENQMSGDRVSPIEQYLCYPRDDAYFNCDTEIDSDYIPRQLIDAEIIAASIIAEKGDPFGGADDGKSVASKKVDVLDISYFDNGKTGRDYTINEVLVILQPLFGAPGSGDNQLDLVRWI